jgi:hypothetical protein
MSVNPSPLRPAALACPVCGEAIAILTPSVELTEEQIVEATEMMVLVHVQTRHTTHEVLAALGTARNALMDIAPLADDMRKYETATANAIDEAVERGLAGK